MAHTIEFVSYENGLEEMIEGLVAGGQLVNGSGESQLKARLYFDRADTHGRFHTAAKKRAAIREFAMLLQCAVSSRVSRGLPIHFVGVK